MAHVYFYNDFAELILRENIIHIFFRKNYFVLNHFFKAAKYLPKTIIAIIFFNANICLRQ